MCCIKPHRYYQYKALYVPIFEQSYRYMGGAPKPRRRMTPADCADRINELNIDERKMMLAMLRHQKLAITSSKMGRCLACLIGVKSMEPAIFGSKRDVGEFPTKVLLVQPIKAFKAKKTPCYHALT